MKRFFALIALLVCMPLANAANPLVEFDTTQGKITLELYPEKAPKTVANFLEYVNSGFYNGTVFHRVIDGFMIQGGGFDANMEQKPTRAPIENESRNGLKNLAGTIAMARTQAPHSATAQFFINLVDNAPLDPASPDSWGYAVFGKVTEGMDVVRKIGKQPVRNVGFHQNVPAEHIVINAARVLEAR